MTSFLGPLKQARELLTPTLKTSAFLERGVLTPEEFVRAGDELCYRCPTWSWESGQKIRPHLPPDKQYLVTRNVPCRQRCSEVENSGLVLEEDVELMRNALIDDDSDGNDGWMVSHIVEKNKEQSLEDDFDILDAEGESVVCMPSSKDVNEKESSKSDFNSQTNNGGMDAVVVDDSHSATHAHALQEPEEDEYADMADFEEENIVEDEAMMDVVTESNNNIVKVRTYDLSITYDKYYQTPRVWLFGYDENGNPLAAEQMYEDCMSDYVKRTVTLDYHPHTSGVYASIHPCQHGAVMKNIVRNLSKSGESPSVDSYLFIFLKFVSSIIPTINYDFTMEVSASLKKE
eukprot:CAMPEP_0116018340 /NCGR_PEP_ID=MMETSP0321-20121206/8590_1 /TAXON_ID=163516 /ORGANISM="Leptocylindrus danicus var. danicus, Strain B650" /LENGTH=344 /DNA_ID=CAMNT_0003488715 /DNA_START=127 /DNA_END=1161 /DNA_ORIENTATION=-